MSPAEAGALDFEEPDWRERFAEHCERWLKLPYYLAEDNAFNATLQDWRKFHATLLDDGKHRPAPAIDGMIALAKFKVFPPRSLIKDVPHSQETGYQHDDHMWLSVKQEQWRIVGIEDRMLLLERAFEDKQMQINLTTAKWSNYVKSAVEVMDAMRAPLSAMTGGPLDADLTVQKSGLIIP
jgi:hypothetical protein